jgi:hypothetical protein
LDPGSASSSLEVPPENGGETPTCCEESTTAGQTNCTV